MSAYPTKVIDIIWRSLPWTSTLLGVTTLLAWTIGTVLGAMLTQPNAPRILRYILAPILTLSAIPFFLLGLLLIYLLGFQLKWFPLAGGYDQGLLPALDARIILNMVYQSIRASDFYMIQGVVFMIIVAIGLATLILDLIYPLLDPRISYARK